MKKVTGWRPRLHIAAIIAALLVAACLLLIERGSTDGRPRESDSTPPASTEHPSAQRAARLQRAPAPRGRHHSGPRSERLSPGQLEEILYNLERYPDKDARTLCGGCDPYRDELAGTFTDGEQRKLLVVSGLSSYTESELWRLAAKSPRFRAALFEVFPQIVGEADAAATRYGERLGEIHRDRLRAGTCEVASMTEPQPSTDWRLGMHVRVGAGDGKWFITRVYVGQDPELDQAIAGYDAAREGARVVLDQLVQSHLGRR